MSRNGYEPIVQGMMPEERELKEMHRELSNALTKAGWDFAGTGPNVDGDAKGEISIDLTLPVEIRKFSLDDALRELPIRDFSVKDRVELLPGWGLGVGGLDTSVGQVGISYDGPLDEGFGSVVRAMVGLSNIARVERAQI